MYRAAALLYPEALATSVTLPREILHAAAQLSRVRRRRGIDSVLRLYTLDAQPHIRLQTGLCLRVDGTIDALRDCDLLILPAIWRDPRRVLVHAQPVLPLLRELSARGATICSVGSASNLLAAAGLLDNGPATTHWQDFDRFAAAWPQVQLKRRHLITQRERLYCVGSVNSIADFMVHLLGQWYGDRIARAVEAQFSPEARRAYASAAFLAESPESHHDALVREAQDHMEQHPGDAHTLAGLAGLTGLSPRSFGRRFRQATGLTPLAYLRQLRLREARALLLQSDLAVADIAWRCGFSSPSRFSQAFRAATGLSPRRYRVAVLGKRFAAAGAVAAPPGRGERSGTG